MVGLSAIPIIIVQVLAMLYLERRWLRHHDTALWLRLLWWLPALVVVVLVSYLAWQPDFIPRDIRYVDAYILLMGMVAAPMTLLALCSFAGRAYRHVWHTRHNWGNYIGLVAAAGCWGLTVYGTQIEPATLAVRHVRLEFDNLPAGFDGYRIVQFTDAHVGSLVGRRKAWLQRTVDSINAQRADLVVFTGDLQNVRPQEIAPVAPILSRVRGRDGVVSILGNHDYAYYAAGSPAEKAASCRQIIVAERSLGWQLLLNEHRVLRRGGDSIAVVGEENLEKPARADFARAKKGIAAGCFVIRLQHNPRCLYLHKTGGTLADLTLCGHTHGGQIAFMGYNAASLSYSYPIGHYQEGTQHLIVSGGIGGVVTLRIGVKPEIVVITLHKK